MEWGDQAVLFLDAAPGEGGPGSHLAHACIDCIPIPADTMVEAPAWFKQALLTAESEWAQHHAKAVIDTAEKGGLRGAIPAHFPYFHVDFAIDKG